MKEMKVYDVNNPNLSLYSLLRNQQTRKEYFVRSSNNLYRKLKEIYGEETADDIFNAFESELFDTEYGSENFLTVADIEEYVNNKKLIFGENNEKEN